MATSETERRSAVFESQRNRLFGIAYRMLGSAAEAEDVVQDAWLRYSASTSPEHDEALLTTITSRLSLDRLKSARHQREQYVGPWLPEPILTDADPSELVELDETVTMGFLTLLERLGPDERVVFVLHEAFAVPYDEIADSLGTSAANCRQLNRRARQRVQAERPRFSDTMDRSHRLTRAFVNAAMTGTLEELSAMLHDDVVLTSDGGAERYAARRPVVGAQRVSRFLHNLAARRPPGTEVVFVEVNGLPGVVLTFGGEPVIVQELRWDDGRLCEINAVSNPDKLRGVTQDLARRSRPTTLVNPSS